MIPRTLNLSKSNSFFLFGPRGVGKTTLIKSQFDPVSSLYIDLLDDILMDQLLLDFSRFSALIDAPEHREKTVVIDEVQKFPKILNVGFHRNEPLDFTRFEPVPSADRRDACS